MKVEDMSKEDWLEFLRGEAAYEDKKIKSIKTHMKLFDIYIYSSLSLLVFVLVVIGIIPGIVMGILIITISYILISYTKHKDRVNEHEDFPDARLQKYLKMKVTKNEKV